ncbi:MAG TPA: protein kinase, partial [Planctomycetota bacterium]|nr:protein kinase [Planctomycetota bacterium]
MNGSRDQVMLGLALQNGLINRDQALLVKERHQQFSQANRPVSVSAILRALKLVSDQELEKLERAVDESGKIPAAMTAPPAGGARPATAASPNLAGSGGAKRATGSVPVVAGAPVARAGGGTPAAGVPVGGSPPRRSSDQNPTAPTPVQALPSANTKMLGKYRIHSQLGQGGMGAVYLAEDTHLNRKVALKVLPKELASNREFIKRFLAEARVTGKLSHPNIVVAYDIDSSQGLWFMAMEYLEGESIGARL